MKIHAKNTIEKCPFTAQVTTPPDYLHKATFVVISIIERGECDLEVYDSKDSNPQLIEAKRNDCFIIMPFSAIQFKRHTAPNYLQRNFFCDEKVFKKCCNDLSPTLFEDILSSQYPIYFKMGQSEVVYLAEKATSLVNYEAEDTPSIDKAVIYSILSSYISSKTKQVVIPLWIKTLIRKIDDPQFLLLSINDMVKFTNYSHGYVNREFKKYMNVSLKQYVIKKKIEAATTMLATTDVSVQEIVDQYKFCNTSHFIKMFKIYYNMTPAKYRKIFHDKIDLDSYQEWGEPIGKD